jgi:hypothetical protein
VRNSFRKIAFLGTLQLYEEQVEGGDQARDEEREK